MGSRNGSAGLDSDREWACLHDRFASTGVAFTWHEQGECPAAPRPARIRPQVLGICLNLEGHAAVGQSTATVVLPPRAALLFVCGARPVQVERLPRQRHRFLLAELALTYAAKLLRPFADRIAVPVRNALAARDPVTQALPPVPLTGRHLDLLAALRSPPVAAGAVDLWYESKAMELLTEFVFAPTEDEALFCTRRKHLARARTERVVALLRDRLSEPPALAEIARTVGCSPHHLSRTFSAETGLSIPLYLRQLRMDRAAELLRTGRFNVTETALEVGYASLSHFIQAFQETHGCPPGAFAQSTDTKSHATGSAAEGV